MMSNPETSPPAPPPLLPAWARDMATLYRSGAASQFILAGNVNDRFLLPLDPSVAAGPALGSLTDFLRNVLMPRFSVVLSYDLGHGLRVEQGGGPFAQWPAMRDSPELPRQPQAAVETLSRYFRYNANLGRLGKPALEVGCWVRSAHLVAPAAAAGQRDDALNALVLLMRDWAGDALLADSRLATCLIADNLLDLHPLLVNNPRAARVVVPLPTVEELRATLALLAPAHPVALGEFTPTAVGLDQLAAALVGTTLVAVENLLRLKEYHRTPIRPGDLVALKKELVERESNDLIEFIEPRRTLDDLHGNDGLKRFLREDLALWRAGDLAAIPMGYLVCGPVGTGKTYLVECLAGEAGIPVVKLRNFRDKWVGSTEGNLERIFRLLSALGRCYVFLDEADQALGRRDAGAGASDGGLSGRIYSMFAKEMSNPANRGRLVWVLASSRPDLIEVDLKRPGRVDVQLPLFPTATAEESAALLRALCRRRGVELAPEDFTSPAVAGRVPLLLTAGAAEALAVRLYRTVKTRPDLASRDALAEALADYQPPVPVETLRAQIALAVEATSDLRLVPAAFRAGG